MYMGNVYCETKQSVEKNVKFKGCKNLDIYSRKVLILGSLFSVSAVLNNNRMQRGKMI